MTAPCGFHFIGQKIERRILKEAIFRQRITALNFRDLRQITPSNPFANRPQSIGEPGLYLAGGYLVLDLPGPPLYYRKSSGKIRR